MVKAYCFKCQSEQEMNLELMPHEELIYRCSSCRQRNFEAEVTRKQDLELRMDHEKKAKKKIKKMLKTIEDMGRALSSREKIKLEYEIDQLQKTCIGRYT